MVATLIGLGLLAAACGGGSSSPGVASLGSTTTTSQAASQNGNNSSNSNYAAAVAYAQCMQSHGVPNFPDPNSQGIFAFHGQSIDQSTPQFSKATNTCKHLLPNGGQITPAERQQLLDQGLKYSQCMRAHGEPNFPDPSSKGGGVQISLKGIDPHSPQFQAAQKACQSLLPKGGP